MIIASTSSLFGTLFTIANNHILDYGRDCLKDTMDNLKKEGISYIGAGANEEEANKPFIKEINGRKYAKNLLF